MDDLVAWLRAQLDEDERIARLATAGPWVVDSDIYPETIRAEDGTDVVAGGRWGGEASVFASTEDALHIARHDPARVLRQVEATRRIIDQCEDSIRVEDEADCGDRVEAWSLAVRLLALPYADQPGYREEWRPA